MTGGMRPPPNGGKPPPNGGKPPPNGGTPGPNGETPGPNGGTPGPPIGGGGGIGPGPTGGKIGGGSIGGLEISMNHTDVYSTFSLRIKSILHRLYSISLSIFSSFAHHKDFNRQQIFHTYGIGPRGGNKNGGLKTESIIVMMISIEKITYKNGG